MAIHSQRHGVCMCVCVWQKGRTILFHRGAGGGGRVLLPPWPARTVGKPQNRRGGGVGEGDAAEAEGYPVPQGGGGENTP